MLLTPMILIMGVLVFYPIVATFSYSLKKWKLTAPGDIRFIGLKNYLQILGSDDFWYSMQNTLFILVFVVACTTLLGFFIGTFLNIRVRFSGILLALAVLPWALPPFVNGILWRFVFYSGYGFLNKLLTGIGLTEEPGGISCLQMESASCCLHCGRVAERPLYGACLHGGTSVYPHWILRGRQDRRRFALADLPPDHAAAHASVSRCGCHIHIRDGDQRV